MASFHVLDEDVDEYADLKKIDTAADDSIWDELEFYEANQAKADETGLGGTDYKNPANYRWVECQVIPCAA